jgi:hypothetical protein
MTDQNRRGSNGIGNTAATFLRLREDAMTELQEEYERSRYVSSLQQEERAEQAEASRQLIMRTGIDEQHLAGLEAADGLLLDSFLGEVRPPLIEERTSPGNGLHDHISRALLNPKRAENAALLGAEISVINAKGEQKNAWLDSGEIKDAKNDRTGSGWGCNQIIIPVPVRATWWYSWVPPEDGWYSFLVLAAYRGFLILRAHDSLLSCKYAEVKAWSRARVYQYYWHGTHEQQVIKEGSSVIQQAYRIDRNVSFSFYELLQGGDAITLQLWVTLDAWARGGGSYAEINFADGTQNYISSPFVAIWKEDAPPP